MLATRTAAVMGNRIHYAGGTGVDTTAEDQGIESADREIQNAAIEQRNAEIRAGFGGVVTKLQAQEELDRNHNISGGDGGDPSLSVQPTSFFANNVGVVSDKVSGLSAKVKDLFKSQVPPAPPITKAQSEAEVIPTRGRSVDLSNNNSNNNNSNNHSSNSKPLLESQPELEELSEEEILDASTSSYYIGEQWLKFAKWSRWAWQHPWFSSYMFLCIGTAGIVVGLQTYPQFATDPILYWIDMVILISFSLEIVLKIIGEGFKPWNYFCNSEWKWNWFDFMIVFFSLPFLPFGGGGQLKLLRLVRLMRLTKVFKRIPQLNMIMRGLLDSLNFVSYIVLLWFLVIYMYAITGLLVFSKNDPWHFRSMEYAFISLFQITVMDFWGEIMYINYYGCKEYPSVLYTNDPAIGSNEIGGLMYCAEPSAQPVVTIIYFLSYVTITAFCIIPLFIGAVTISMADCVVEMKEEEKRNHRKKCIEQVDVYLASLENPSQQDRKMKQTVKLVGYAFRGNDITLDILRERSNVWILQQYRDVAYWAGEIIEHPKVQMFITVVIMLAGVVVGLQTDNQMEQSYGPQLVLLNDLIQYTFTWELVMKVIAEGEHPYMYFKSSWNTFDFVVVAGSYVPAAGSGVVILRLLRLFRVLKLMRALPQLQVIITGATNGLSAAMYILLIVAIIYYFFAILANAVFASNDPASWGEIHVGMIILVQLATLDNWTTYFYTMVFGCDKQPAPTMFSDSACVHPQAQLLMGTIFFCTFTIFGSYVLLALFVGSIGMAMDEANDEQYEELRIQKRVEHIQKTLNLNNYAISRYHDVFLMIDITGSNRIGRDELKFGLRVAGEILAESDFERLWRKVDKDKTQDVDFSEFLTFMLDMRELHLEKNRRMEAAQTESVFGGDSPMDRGRMKRSKSSKFDMLRASLAGPSDQELIQEAMKKAHREVIPEQFGGLNDDGNVSTDDADGRQVIEDLVHNIKRTMSGSKSDTKTPSFKLDMDATRMSFSKIPEGDCLEEASSLPRNDLELADFDVTHEHQEEDLKMSDHHPAQRDPNFASSKYVFGSPAGMSLRDNTSGAGAGAGAGTGTGMMSPGEAELSEPLRASPRMKPIPAPEALSSSYKSAVNTPAFNTIAAPAGSMRQLLPMDQDNSRNSRPKSSGARFPVMDKFTDGDASPTSGNGSTAASAAAGGGRNDIGVGAVDMQLRDMSPSPDNKHDSTPDNLPQTSFHGGSRSVDNSPKKIYQSVSHDDYGGLQYSASSHNMQTPARMQKMSSTGTGGVIDRSVNANNSLFRTASPIYKSDTGTGSNVQSFSSLDGTSGVTNGNDVTPVRYMQDMSEYGSLNGISGGGSISGGSLDSRGSVDTEERLSRRKKYNVISVPSGNRRVKIMAI